MARDPAQGAADFTRDGYVVAQGLFSPAEAEAYSIHFMKMRAERAWPGDSPPLDLQSPDPLKRFPRLIHMHRWDPKSLQWLIDARLRTWTRALTGHDPFAVQTMLYFKPAGARGQALHQDQYYLKARPGTCVAAWMALDRCDEGNGCLQVVPGTADLPVLCTEKADGTLSFTDVTVPLPASLGPVPVVMDPGDVLFFNGSVVHGSLPNVSRDRFRRALIGHYVTGDSEQVAKFYHPALDMNGREVGLSISEGGGPCGVWSGDLVVLR